MTFTSQTRKAAYFSLPSRFPALGKSRAQAGCTPNFWVTLLRSCAIPVLSLLMASLFMPVSLSAVAQSLPEVSILTNGDVIDETETVQIYIRRDEMPQSSLTVTISVSDPGSAISGTVATTHTILSGDFYVTFDIPTNNIDTDSQITVSIATSNAYDISATQGEAIITVQNAAPATVDVSPPDGATGIADGETVEFTLTRTTADRSQSLDVRVSVDDFSPGPLGYVSVLPAGQEGIRTVTIPANSSEVTFEVRTLNVPVSQIEAGNGALIVVRVESDTASPRNYGIGNNASTTVAINGNPNASAPPDTNTTPPDMTDTPDTMEPPDDTVQNTPDTTTTPDTTPPVVTYTDPTSLEVETPVNISPETDDTDIASYSATGLPDGLMINPTTGVISGAPTTEETATSTATITVTDIAGNPATVTVNFPAVSTEDTTPPMVTYMPPGFLVQGTEIFEIEPDTDDTDIVSYSATGLPAGLEIDSESGVISGTPITENPNPSTATITVRDDANNSADVMLEFPAVDPDTTVPTLVEVVNLGGERTNSQEVTWRLFFSEAVQNVGDMDFRVELDPEDPMKMPQVQPNTFDPREYTVTVEGLDNFEGTVELILASNQDIADLSGLPLDTTTSGTDEDGPDIETLLNGLPFLVDTILPMVEILDVPDTASGPFTATIRFSEAVNGFELEDIMVSNNAMLSDFTRVTTSGTDLNTAWMVTVTPQEDGAVTLDIAPGAAEDDFRNGNTAASQVMSNYFGVPYMLQQPIVDDETLTLDFGIPLDEMGNPPSAEAFTVMVNDMPIRVDRVDFGSIRLHLARPLPEGTGMVRYDANASTAAGTSPLMTADNQQIGDFDLEFDVLSAAEAAARRAGRPLEAYLPRFGRTVGEQAAAAVRNRISANRSAGFQGQIAGRSIGLRESGDAGQAGAHNRAVFLTLLERGVDATSPLPTTSPSSWSLTSEEVLLGTSFAFTRDTDAGMSLGFWGQASQSGFDGHGVAGNIDGRVTGVQLGADWRQGASIIGLMVSRSRGSGDVAGTTTAAPGEMKSDLTALIPYGGVEVSSTLSLWGAAGLGRGDVTFTQTDGVSARTDIDWSMLTGGARGALGNAAALGGASLDWIADALWTATLSDALPGAPSSAISSDTTRVRAGVEASWAQVLDSGSIQTPRLSLGLRHDGGDAEDGTGS